ncbi:DegV family protein [Agrilactobacillus fermenti]|uniref:DegV family protein n=1 Tax=Agrilactobacillus fermenti TaxID=2586909 RepID=UPI001E612803|nr:DegV family protein [Agrilactobacillus fermenti]MCD2255434.1 DegV family protein [Agrilactobacillus fermenti]
MSVKIGLLVDSASDIPAEIAKQDNVEIVPLIVNYDHTEYFDRQTIQPEEVYQLLDQDKIPKTASPTIGLVQKGIEHLVAKGYHQIIAVTISSGLSITNQVFIAAAQQNDALEMSVVDSKSVGIGSGLIAAYAQDLINEHLDFKVIVDRISKSVRLSRVYFYIPTMKYLIAGGRIGKVAGILGSALGIKPVISCDTEGIYYPIIKSRSETKALNKLVNIAVGQAQKAAHFKIAVAQGNDTSLMHRLVDKISAQLPMEKIYTGSVSPALAVHTGPGLVGIAVQAN